MSVRPVDPIARFAASLNRADRRYRSRGPLADSPHRDDWEQRQIDIECMRAAIAELRADIGERSDHARFRGWMVDRQLDTLEECRNLLAPVDGIKTWGVRAPEAGQGEAANGAGDRT